MTRRAHSTASATRAPSTRHAPERSDNGVHSLGELTRWRRGAIPDSDTPLDAEDLVRLTRECVVALQLDPAIVADLSVNTIHYYRRKDIIDPPIGRTAAARYVSRHLWQVAGARLAGHLGLATLAEARDAVRGADERTAMEFLAARIADARARAALRQSTPTYHVRREVRPLPGARASNVPPTEVARANVVTLPGGAWCVIPDSHAALRSREAADALVHAFASALTSIKHL